MGRLRKALDTLSLAKKNGHFEKTPADRRRAVLLAAQAQDKEENRPEQRQRDRRGNHGVH